MPLPRRLARFNVHVTNRVLGVVARRVPPFAIVHHVGRRTGKPYETPVMVFRRGGTAVIALTYGAGADWVRNVLSADGCDLVVRGTATRWTEARVVRTGAVAERVPTVVRFALRALRSHEFLQLRAAD